jgi:type IV pilus assembly protein PilN
MRIPVNLASEPFRRDRPLIIGSVAAGLLLLATLAMFTFMSMREREHTAEARQRLATLNEELRSLAAEQTKLDGVLRQPRNAEVLDRSQFVNALLQRKAVSWTKIFEDLERVVPHNVRVIQVRPQINPNNELLLDMIVGSQAGESILNLLMQLEASDVFGAVSIHSIQPPSQADPLYRYRVSVRYAQKL